MAKLIVTNIESALWQRITEAEQRLEKAKEEHRFNLEQQKLRDAEFQGYVKSQTEWIKDLKRMYREDL